MRECVLIAGGGTGGHLYPAINLAGAIGRLDSSVRCVLVGTERGLEASVLPKSGFEFRLLPLEPVYRSRPWLNLRHLVRAPAVLRGLRSIFAQFRPSLVVGTGGYVSGLPLLWARLRGVPTAVQEQNAVPGIATRFMAPRVNQVHLAYPEAARHLGLNDAQSVFSFGNPVATGRTADADRFDWPGGPVLLVFGGSQGARGLNRALLRDLEVAGTEADLEGLSIVWIAGRGSFDEVSTRVAALSCVDRIRVTDYIDNLGSQLDRIDLAVCRAGAMSVAELCAAGRPAVLVPLPTSTQDHQLWNARALAGAGAAEMREEGDLLPGELLDLCVSLIRDPGRLEKMGRAARTRGRPDAADLIGRELLKLRSRA